MSIADDFRAQVEKLKFRPDHINSIHGKIRHLARNFDEPGPEMRDILDFHVSHPEYSVPVRLYVPFGAPESAGPSLLYIHGGGFVTCNLESHESICLRIADAANMRVFSVDYRLAPQHPFPAGPDDCERVLQWMLGGDGREFGIDPENLSIGGDSAGGNMSAYLAQKYRAQLKAQVLLYPVMQLAQVKPANPGPQDVLRLGEVALNFIIKHYVAGADVNHPRLSPLFEKDLANLPPCFVLTCGLDPLREEGKLYADNLRAHGNIVKSRHEKAMPHGYLNFARAFSPAKTLSAEIAGFLQSNIEAL